MWLPVTILSGIQVLIANKLAPILAFRMLREKKNWKDLGTAVKTSIGIQATCSTLFFNAMWSFLRVRPIVDGGSQLLGGWFVSLCAVAMAQAAVATAICIMCLMTLSQLGDKAALKIVGDNLMYFGEPLALSACGFINAVTCTILWICGHYGFGAGLAAGVSFGYAVRAHLHGQLVP